MKRSGWFATALLLVLVAAAVHAQRFGESVQVTVVEVPVTVVDRAGNPVRNLTKEDFEVFDDGKRVPLDYFEVVDMAKLATADPSQPLPAAANRHFLLLFDVANSSPGTIGRAGEAAKEFVNKQLGEHDLAAVAVFTAEKGARMITSFTHDQKLLTNAIETLGQPNFFKIADPLMISATRTSSGESGGAGTSEAGRGGMDAAFQELSKEQERMSQTVQDSELRARLKIQLNNFGFVARALDRIKGQKQVILLSEGFDARLVQGREDVGGDKAKEEAEDTLNGEVWKVDNEQRFGNTGASRDVSDMAALFRRSDVVLHAIDIKGLRSDVDASAGLKKKSNEALYLLTSPTGGSVFKNANDMSQSFGRMLKQQEVVYILGFQAAGTGKPGKFHELKVKTKAGRATNRAGYYETGGRVSDLERTLSLAEILVTDAAPKDVTISVTPLALPGPGGKARVPVLVEIPGTRLLEGIKGNAATANLYLYAFDQNDQVVDFMQQRIGLDLTKAGEAVRGSGVRYFGTLRLAPGTYAVKALVRVEETERTGFVRTDLTVPAFDKAVVLPPVMFVEPQNWVMLVGPMRGDDYSYPFSVGDQRYIPSRGSTLSNSTDYKLALFLYRVPLENLEVQPVVIDSSGASHPATVKLLGRTAADDRGGVKLVFSFKPENIPAGTHQLRLTVKAKDGNESVVTMPFQVL
jgi:VWFA-related protein